MRTITAHAQNLHCYIGDVHVQGADAGPLNGLKAAVKDSYDICGYKTSNGSPVWRDFHPPATATAPTVQALIDAGASIIGKTIMDELAYSLHGMNFHYGTPVNPACPDRTPGGSSSGSASAVAGGDADIGLGGDTGGSIRIPASFCGIYGIRPTHGRVSLAGSCPLAPSFDTGGWLCRDASLLQRVGDVLLLPQGRQSRVFRRWIVAKDAFDIADTDTGRALYSVLSSKIDQVRNLLGAPTELTIGDVSTKNEALSSLHSWTDVFRVHQAYEAWRVHGAWLTETQPTLGPGVKERFDVASKITDDQFHNAITLRSIITQHLEEILGDDGILTIPTAAGPAPKLESPPEFIDEFRGRLLTLTSIAGLSGLPEITLPLARVDGCPVGLSLIGPRGSDEDLLVHAQKLSEILELHS